MWRLISDNLRYSQTTALGTTAAAILLAAAIHAVLSYLLAYEIVPPPDPDFNEMYLYPLMILLASLIVAVSAQTGDLREDRIRLQAILPRSKTQVGLARVLTPAVFIVLGLGFAQVLLGVIYFGWGKADFMASFFLAGWFLFVLEFVLLNTELESWFSRSPVYKALVPVVAGAAILLFVAGLLARRFLAIDSPLVTFLHSIPDFNVGMVGALKLYGMSMILIGLNFLLFMRRKSLVG